jgi:hypothetical protein
VILPVYTTIYQYISLTPAYSELLDLLDEPSASDIRITLSMAVSTLTFLAPPNLVSLTILTKLLARAAVLAVLALYLPTYVRSR